MIGSLIPVRKMVATLFILLAVTTLFFPHATQAGDRIIIVTSGGSEIYNQVVDQLNTTLSTLCLPSNDCPRPITETLDLENLDTSSKEIETAALIVTLGTKAAQKLVEIAPPVPLLFTLIPREAAELIPAEKLRARHSVIYLDQPPERQLKLALQMTPARTTVGVLAGPSNRGIGEQLVDTAKRFGLTIITELVESESDLGPAMKRLMDQSDVLLALPDSSIYNRKTIFNVLLTSYHSKVPVISFSSAYVKAGATLGIYTSPTNVGRHIAEVVNQYLKSRLQELPPPAYTRYFSIAVNAQVARSLNITVPSPLELEKRMRELEP